MLTYKGVVKGKVIELEEQVALPEGTEVEVIVTERQEVGGPPAVPRRVRLRHLWPYLTRPTARQKTLTHLCGPLKRASDLCDFKAALTERTPGRELSPGYLGVQRAHAPRSRNACLVGRAHPN